MKTPLKNALLVALLTLFCLLALLASTDRLTYTHPDFPQNWDHHKYLYMAQHEVLALRVAPFGWRPLNPLLASLLPWDLQTNFAVLSFTFLWLTGIAFFFVLKQLEFSSSLALAGVLFFLSLGWATRFNIYDFWLTDPLAFLFSIGAILAVLTDSTWTFACLLTVGVLAKENVLFVAPLFYTLKTERIVDWRLARMTLLLASPAAAVSVLLRAQFPALNTNHLYLASLAENLLPGGPYNLICLFENIGLRRLEEFSLDSVIACTFGTFGVSLVLLPLFALRTNWLTFWRFSPLMVLTCISLLMVGNTERVLVAMFPALIVMALHGLERIRQVAAVDDRMMMGLPLVLLLLLLCRPHWFVVLHLLEGLLLVAFLAFALQAGEGGRGRGATHPRTGLAP